MTPESPTTSSTWSSLRWSSTSCPIRRQCTSSTFSSFSLPRCRLCPPCRRPLLLHRRPRLRPPPRGQRRSPSRNTARASRELRGRRQRRGRPVRVLPPPCGGVGVLPPPGRARRVGRPGSLLGTARMTRWLKPPLPSVEELSLVVTLIHAGLLGPGRGGASPADTDGPQSAGLRPYRLSSAAR